MMNKVLAVDFYRYEDYSLYFNFLYRLLERENSLMLENAFFQQEDTAKLMKVFERCAKHTSAALFL